MFFNLGKNKDIDLRAGMECWSGDLCLPKLPILSYFYIMITKFKYVNCKLRESKNGRIFLVSYTIQRNQVVQFHFKGLQRNYNVAAMFIM